MGIRGLPKLIKGSPSEEVCDLTSYRAHVDISSLFYNLIRAQSFSIFSRCIQREVTESLDTSAIDFNHSRKRKYDETSISTDKLAIKKLKGNELSDSKLIDRVQILTKSSNKSSLQLYLHGSNTLTEEPPSTNNLTVSMNFPL